MAAIAVSKDEHPEVGNDASDGERRRLEEKCRDLRSKLQAIRRRRGEVREEINIIASEQQSSCLEERNRAEHNRTEALDQYHLAVSRRRLVTSRLETARKWNVTNDCFFLWHRGPFGTINGLRLGSEVPAFPSTGTLDCAVVKTTAEVTPSTLDSGAAGILGSLWGTDNSAVNPTNSANESTDNRSELNGDGGFKVPWVEINSALGLVALLLSTLEQKPHSGIHFTNQVVPMGSSSKIGLRRGESVTIYNLYSDDSFQFFGKRNFNIALNGLLSCVADAALAVQKRDRTIALPHPIELTAQGDHKIGGLSVSYGNDGQRWTRAMKYLLTDLKWLVAFTAKHVDR